MLVEFSLTCIFQHVWETLFTLGCHIARKSSNLCFLFMSQSPHSKLRVEFFENVSTKTERVEEAIICSVKIQSENVTMTWNISLFPFGMIAIFLNVMALQFCK